jgi:hypothetical protein
VKPLYWAVGLVAAWLIARNLIEKVREEKAGGTKDVIGAGSEALQKLFKLVTGKEG